MTLASPGAAGSLGDNKDIVIDTTTAIDTATGTGTVTVSTDNGAVQVTPVLPAIITTPPPDGVVLTNGLFDLVIALPSGESATLTLVFSFDIPEDTAWWKYSVADDLWYQIDLGDNDGDDTVTITLVDGGVGDDDGIANGVIIDPSGPASGSLVDSVTTVSNNYFDMNKDEDGQQFRLLFTPGGSYTLTSSNKGQFMYKVILTGPSGADFDLDVEIPYPFVTVGSNPVHVSPVAGNVYTVTDGVIVLADYGGSPELGVTTTTINVTGEIPDPQGYVEVGIHLAYGLKGTPEYAVGINNLADHGSENYKDIPDFTSYAFYAEENNSGLDDPDPAVIESQNVFKRDPGFAGIVTDSSLDPLSGFTVEIYGPTGTKLATVYTDENGYYFYYYKYSGKQATFTIKLTDPDPDIIKTVQVKSNQFVITNFIVP